jgi:ribosome biogenesis GTPase / thiamine phosphate phosphatase
MSAPAATTKATVVASFGRFCTVRLADGQQVNAYARGKRSDAVCGDVVQVSRSSDEAVIERIQERRNSLFRQDETRTKVFAANLDQVLFMVAGKPTFNDDLLGRAMIACHVAKVPVVIALNKRELPEAAAARERLKLYTQLGYSVVECSAKPAVTQETVTREAVTQEDWLAPIKAVLQGKTTLVLGGSGVGKSTLINALVPNAKAATQAISEALNSGKHTTTATLAYQLDEHSVLMDSPGFQTFGLHHISSSQLPDAMPEFHAAREQHGGCKFYNCTHLREPGCAVLAAIAQGEISPMRHALYAQVLEELQQEKW